MKLFNSNIWFLVLMFTFCFVGSVKAQEQNKPAIQLRSIMVSPIGVYDTNDNRPGGIAFAGDVTLAINKHLIILGVNAGASLGIFGDGDSYADVNVRYGRAFTFTSFFETELHAGVGYFRFSYASGGISLFDDLSGAPLKSFNASSSGTQQTVGFPAVAKLKFRTGPRFVLGLYGSYNINSVANLFSTGFMLQWNFIKD